MRIGVVVAGFCTFLPVYAVQPLLPEFQRVFSASTLATSLTVSAVTTAVALASPGIGALADAWGRKRVIVPAILGLAVATFLAATSANLSQLIAWRFVQGLFVPGIIAVALAYVAEEAQPGTAASVMAGYVTGTVLGGMSGRFVTALVAAHHGWRWSMFVLGLVTLAGCLVTWLCLPRSRRFVRQPDPWHSLRLMLGHFGNRRLLATYCVGFNTLFTHVGVFTYVSFYLAGEPFRMGLVALGSVFFVYGLGAIVTPVAGLWIDRFGYRAGMVAATAIVAIGALLTLVPLTWVVILGLAVFSTGIFIAQSTASSHIGAAARHARSSAAGLYVSFYYLGGSAGATLLGLLWSWQGWQACVACLVFIQIVSALVALRLFVSAPTHTATPDSILSA